MRFLNTMNLLRPKAWVAMAVFFCGAFLSSASFAQFNAFKDPAMSSGGAEVTASGPDLKAEADAVQGGKVTVGATIYIVTIFKNSGTSDVKILGTNLYPSSTVSAKVSANKCADAPLPPEAECAVTIAVTGLQLGAWRVEILLDHDGKTRLAASSVTGDVDGSTEKEDDKVKADVEAVPEVLDFGSSAGGVPLVRSVLLRNRTSDEVKLETIKLDSAEQSGFVYHAQCPEALKPGESCVIGVTWNPTTKGLSQSVLTVNHSARSRLTQVEVKGTFAPQAVANAPIYPDSAPDMGLLISDKEKIEFGTGIKGVSAITTSLVNVGSMPLTIKNIRLAGSDNGLSVARSGCNSGTILKPTDACALTVNWVPSREGVVIDDLQILHSGARGVLVLPIRGTADAAASRETLAVRQPTASLGSPDVSSKAADSANMESSVPVTPVLDGYVVTSLSSNKAVINGPVGSLVVRDGEDVVVSGVKWTVTIVSTGVILTSSADEILLVFDRSLKPKTTSSSGTSSSGSTSSSSGTMSSGSTTSSSSSGTSSTKK